MTQFFFLQCSAIEREREWEVVYVVWFLFENIHRGEKVINLIWKMEKFRYLFVCEFWGLNFHANICFTISSMNLFSLFSCFNLIFYPFQKFQRYIFNSFSIYLFLRHFMFAYLITLDPNDTYIIQSTDICSSNT